MDDFFKYELPRIKRMESEAFYTLAREEGFQEGNITVQIHFTQFTGCFSLRSKDAL